MSREEFNAAALMPLYNAQSCHVIVWALQSWKTG
jgi:hypothetical protein